MCVIPSSADDNDDVAASSLSPLSRRHTSKLQRTQNLDETISSAHEHFLLHSSSWVSPSIIHSPGFRKLPHQRLPESLAPSTIWIPLVCQHVCAILELLMLLLFPPNSSHLYYLLPHPFVQMPAVAIWSQSERIGQSPHATLGRVKRMGKDAGRISFKPLLAGNPISTVFLDSTAQNLRFGTCILNF